VSSAAETSTGDSSALSGLLAANERYAATFSHARLPAAPRLGLAILTCMDARLDPAKALGLQEGDAHVIRNAGGRASDDAIRSLIVSHLLLGVREVLVIHHTDCGLQKVTNEELRERLRSISGADISNFDFLVFTNVEASIREDVQTIRSSPLLGQGISVSGLIYHVHRGRLQDVC
jgi:carbonic anhydrase